MSRNVVVISLADTLEAIGLRTLLEKSLGVHAVMVNPGEVEQQCINVGARSIITDSETFLSHLDFFLPRRKQVIVVGEKESYGNLMSISPKMEESELIDCLNNLIATESLENASVKSELSQREVDVLRLVVAGKINKEIAAELGISINTVLTHRKNITSKLGIKSVSGLSFYALMNNLV